VQLYLSKKSSGRDNSHSLTTELTPLKRLKEKKYILHTLERHEQKRVLIIMSNPKKATTLGSSVRGEHRLTRNRRETQFSRSRTPISLLKNERGFGNPKPQKNQPPSLGPYHVKILGGTGSNTRGGH